MEKLTIFMSYTGDKIQGQGVGSATIEQINLISHLCATEFKVVTKSKKYDILHVHTIDPRSIMRAKNTTKPVVTHVHLLPETLQGSIKLPKSLMRMMMTMVVNQYHRSDKLVVVNPSFIKDLKRYGIDEKKIEYIPNFVSEENFFEKTQTEKEAIRAQFNIKKDAFVVLGVGQVQTRKGVLDFVEVAKSLPDIQFVWAGGFSFGSITDGHKELKKIMDHPPENVLFTGIIPRAQMNDIYNMADVLFMPSYNELFPMAILEACSTNTPILLRDLELYEDILFDHYLRGSNNETFSSLIHQLSVDQTFYQEALNHAQIVKTFYSRENIKLKWIKFYQSLYKEHEGKKLNHKKNVNIKFYKPLIDACLNQQKEE